MKLKIAIYPGSFNPIHQGHIDILIKALKLFDMVYVVVSINPDKNSTVSIEQRFELVSKKLSGIERVKVLINKDNFIANIAKELGACFIIRSARNLKDFNYEMELAAGNKYLNDQLETILIIPDYKYINFSSTLLRHKRKLKKDV